MSIGLEGHDVTVLTDDDAELAGELRHYSAEGATVWIHPYGSYGHAEFIPAARIKRIVSRGEGRR